MHMNKPILQYIRESCLKDEPCASCDVSDENTRCYYNAYFTNCSWTGKALPWARKLEGTYITVDVDTASQTEVSE